MGNQSNDAFRQGEATNVATRKPRQARAIATSRLTSKRQVTVPGDARKRLNLKPDDRLIFREFEAGIVCIRKAEPLDIEFLSALETTLSE
jgi:antitoxin PrlF